MSELEDVAAAVAALGGEARTIAGELTRSASEIASMQQQVASAARSGVPTGGVSASLAESSRALTAAASSIDHVEQMSKRIAGLLVGQRGVGRSASSGRSVNKPVVESPVMSSGALLPNVRYRSGEHDYEYETDSHGRVCWTRAAPLVIKKHEGRQGVPAQPRGMLASDDRGHLWADLFGGAMSLENIVAMDSYVNRHGEYRRLEIAWCKALEEGLRVEVEIRPVYKGASDRPYQFEIRQRIAGRQSGMLLIPNG